MVSEFVVRPFAFMRLTHEAIRDGVESCRALGAQLAEEADAERLTELQGVFDQTRRGIAVHAAIEDAGFFPLLDERFERTCERAGFREQHVAEDQRHAAIERALADLAKTPSAAAAAALRDLIDDWAREVEQHLVQEEELMMPLTQQVAADIEGRAAAVHAIIDTHREDVESVLIPWVAARLEASRPFGPLRMFVSAVSVVHSAEERRQIEPRLRAALSADAVEKLTRLGAFGAEASA